MYRNMCTEEVGKDSSILIHGAPTDLWQQINLSFTTQIIPGNFEKWANASGLQEKNSNLQMNSELMCKYKLAALLTVSPFFLCMFHDTHCPHPSLSLNGKKEQHMLIKCIIFFHALAKQKQRGNFLQNIKVISRHNIQSC